MGASLRSQKYQEKITLTDISSPSLQLKQIKQRDKPRCHESNIIVYYRPHLETMEEIHNYHESMNMESLFHSSQV